MLGLRSGLSFCGSSGEESSAVFYTIGFRVKSFSWGDTEFRLYGKGGKRLSLSLSHHFLSFSECLTSVNLSVAAQSSPTRRGCVPGSASYQGVVPSPTGLAPDGSMLFGAAGPPFCPPPILQASSVFTGHLSTALACSRVGNSPGQLSRGLHSPGAAPCGDCSQIFRARPDRAEEAAA